MTRDRPASGGIDSTLEGEFPSELGSGSGGRASPLQVDNRVSVPYGGEIDARNYAYSQQAYDSVNFNYITGGGPVMRIYNKPLYDAGIASVSLNGIYANTETTAFYNNYPFWFSRVDTRLETNINTTGTTLTTTFTAAFNNYDYTRPALFGFSIDASAAGTTIPPGSIQMQGSVRSISPGYFTGITTYQDISPLMSVENARDITTGETMSMSFVAPPAPAFAWEYKNPQQGIRRVPFLPNTDTELTFDLTINIGSFGQTNASVRMDFNMLHNFTRAQNLDVVKEF